MCGPNRQQHQMRMVVAKAHDAEAGELLVPPRDDGCNFGLVDQATNPLRLV